MSDRTTNASGPPQQAAQSGPSSETQRVNPKIWMVILLALIAIIFTALWLGIYSFLNTAIWKNSFVTSNKWTIPVGVLFFSLLVGLAQKYLRAPTVINGGALAAMKGGGQEKTDYRTFPGALLSSFCSLLSGASVGPEGALGALVQDITAWISEKLKVPEESKLGLSLAALASAYNGIIGSPLFTGVLATEFQIGGKELGIAFLAWNPAFGCHRLLFLHVAGFTGLCASYPLYAHQHTETRVCALCHRARPGGGTADAVHRDEFPGLRQDHGAIRRAGHPANHGRGGDHRHRGLFLPGIDVRRVCASQAYHPKSSIVRCSVVAALCATQDLAAGTLVQERVPGRSDIPNPIFLHDGRHGAEPALPGHSCIHPGAVH
jgi:hypothetical protein